MINLSGCVSAVAAIAAALVSATALVPSAAWALPPAGYTGEQTGAHSRWGESYLPNTVLIDQNGEKVPFYSGVLKGKIVVVSFIYTTCRNICPLVISRLAEVYDKLQAAGGEGIAFVSISIDPIPDTPERLKAYAEAFKIKGDWKFLTGTPEDIDLVRYKLGERSGGTISQHKNDILLFNDATGEWARDSAMADIDNLVMTIRAMDPRLRAIDAKAATGSADKMPAHPTTSATDVPGRALFVKACSSCHSIGRGEKVGPDLAGLSARRTQAWIKAYMTAPEKLRAAGDATAMDLNRRFSAVRMPNLSLSENDANDLIAYIDRIGHPAADHAAVAP